MAEYNPEALEAEAEGDYDIDYHGTIVGVEMTDAEDIFGEAAYDPSRSVIEVFVDTEADTEVREVFTMPDPDNPGGSWKNPNFKLGQFRSKYGQVPEVGLEVDITVDDEGFLAIDY